MELLAGMATRRPRRGAEELLTSGLTRNGYGLENKFGPRGSLDRPGSTDFKLRLYIN
jgi:hypothetical protein